MNKNPLRLESESPEAWVSDVLAGKHAPVSATPTQAGAAAKEMLTAMKRAKAREARRRAARAARASGVRPGQARTAPKPAKPAPLPRGPVNAMQKDQLRRKFWGPGGYDPATAGRIVDILLGP